MLSVCTLTSAPGPRVAALLGRLRDVAGEIVVAADARAEPERLRAYASVADRVLRVEFDYLERHLGWLHAQCRGDWILRIDGDEVPSPALVEQLPHLIRRRDVQQCLVPRRWLFPDADHWLAELPWWPDYQVRLVRNDGLLRFPGTLHSSALPVRPALYLEAPILHLDLILSNIEERRSKSLRYEAIEPGAEAPGGGPLSGRFYLPERYRLSRPDPLDPREAVAVREVLEPSRPPSRPAPAGPAVTLAESDRFWAGRQVAEGAYRATIAPVERDHRMLAGERRALHFRVVNEGDERWPWDGDIGPTIRASYRWRHASGALVTADGLRTPFPCSVAPGEATVIPLDVLAPMRAGAFELEVDVVHEHVRWFGCVARVPVAVAPRPEPARMRRRLPRPRISRRRRRGGSIPPNHP